MAPHPAPDDDLAIITGSRWWAYYDRSSNPPYVRAIIQQPAGDAPAHDLVRGRNVYANHVDVLGATPDAMNPLWVQLVDRLLELTESDIADLEAEGVLVRLHSRGSNVAGRS